MNPQPRPVKESFPGVINFSAPQKTVPNSYNLIGRPEAPKKEEPMLTITDLPKPPPAKRAPRRSKEMAEAQEEEPVPKKPLKGANKPRKLL